VNVIGFTIHFENSNPLRLSNGTGNLAKPIQRGLSLKGFAAILHDKNEMVLERENRISSRFQFHKVTFAT
jgi:hypothetical protein